MGRLRGWRHFWRQGCKTALKEIVDKHTSSLRKGPTAGTRIERCTLSVFVENKQVKLAESYDLNDMTVFRGIYPLLIFVDLFLPFTPAPFMPGNVFDGCLSDYLVFACFTFTGVYVMHFSSLQKLRCNRSIWLHIVHTTNCSSSLLI